MTCWCEFKYQDLNQQSLTLCFRLRSLITVVGSSLLGESTVLHAVTLNSDSEIDTEMLQAFIKC